AYACPPPGAYVTMRTLPAAQLVLLPDHVDEETAAALMLKGMTAEYLLHRIHRVKPGDTVLVHATAGGGGVVRWLSGAGVGGPGARRTCHRHGFDRSQSGACSRERLRASDRDAVLFLRREDETAHRWPRGRRDLRRPRARGGTGKSGGARHARPLGELRASDR